jgi:amino acid adenylation domain-containing protein
MIHPLAGVVLKHAAGHSQAATPTTLVQLFATQAAARPLAPALEINDKRFSYAFLSDQADEVAHRLRAKGIGRGDVVAICLKRTENLIIAMLGVMKSGAAYLPLSPGDPALRLGQVIAHATVSCIVTDANSDANLPGGPTPVLKMESLPGDDLKEDPSGAIKETWSWAPQADDLAYVIYTSGTTGVPKGVAITHSALANVTADVAHRVAFVENASWLAVTTVSFDIAALELLLPLCYGGKVILATEDQARMGRVLSAILTQKRPSVMQATPITWRILIESGWRGSADLTILCGGDRLDRSLANQLVDRCAALWNMYGPTETTIWSTADRVTPGKETVTIGQPMLNTEVYILDGDGQRKPDGEVGEICIGGAGVARGYVNDPRLTQERFIELQIEGADTVRVYRTGDLGRWNADGKIDFYGRMDHQVKINGFRIELAEIEQAIRGCPGIVDVAVLGVGGTTNQKRLYAFVVAAPQEPLTASRLVAHLEQYLPHYMIPERFWSLPQLPATPNGKRNGAALEAVARDQPELTG